MSNHKVYLALYKGKKEGRGLKVRWARFRDWLVRTVTRSPYSHCEIAVTVHPKTLYTCYSASARDGGVRCKVMALPAEKWDLIPLPESCIQSAVGLYARTQGARYDWSGAIGTVLKTPPSRGRWFCSEWCAQAFGLIKPWRYSPQKLAMAVKGD